MDWIAICGFWSLLGLSLFSIPITKAEPLSFRSRASLGGTPGPGHAGLSPGPWDCPRSLPHLAQGTKTPLHFSTLWWWLFLPLNGTGYKQFFHSLLSISVRSPGAQGPFSFIHVSLANCRYLSASLTTLAARSWTFMMLAMEMTSVIRMIPKFVKYELALVIGCKRDHTRHV